MIRESGRAQRAAWIAVIAAGALLLQGCFTKPFDPVLPTWEVGVTAPISSKTYTLADLVTKNPALLTAGSGGELIFRSSAEAPPAQLGRIFTLAPFHTVTGANLGALDIGAIAPLRIPVRIPGAAPGLPVPPLNRISLPATPFTVAQFEEIQIESGALTLRIENNLPVPLTIDSTITLRDAAGGIIIALPFPVNTVPAGGFLSAVAALGGKRITSHLTIANVCVSTSEGIASLPAGDLIVASIATSSIVVSHAVLSSIPPQRLMDNSRFAIPFRDSTRIREVLIASGELALDITSQVAMNMLYHVRFPQLRTAQGVPFTDSLRLDAGKTVHVLIPLGGLRLVSTTSGFIEELEAITSADLYEGSGGLPVTVSQSDSIRMQVASSIITIDHLAGAVKPTVVAIDRKIGVQLGATGSLFRGQFLFPSADLTLIPRSDLDLPMELNLTLKATDASGAVVQLPVPVTKTSGRFEPITFVPEEVGAFLSKFSGRFPDTLRLIGTVVLNPDYDTMRVTSVTSTSVVGAGVDLAIPLRVAISGGSLSDTVAVGDTTGDGKSDFLPAGSFFDNVSSGRIHVELENRIPVRAGVKVVFLDASRRTLLVLPQTAGDSLTVAASPGLSSRVLPLTGEEVQLLRRAVTLVYGIGLDTPGAGAVTFRTTDGITLRLWSEMTYRVDP